MCGCGCEELWVCEWGGVCEVIVGKWVLGGGCGEGCLVR